MDKLIKRIYTYAKNWIVFFGGNNYNFKYLHTKSVKHNSNYNYMTNV